MIVQDLDMAARIEVLNRRLNIVHELCSDAGQPTHPPPLHHH